MHQILFEIPLKTWTGVGWDLPIHGYGFMLFLAFVSCLVLTIRLAKTQGISAETVQDLAIWLFVPGLIGARFDFVLTELPFFLSHPWTEQPIVIFGIEIYLPRVVAVWDGGLVFFGSAIGGLIGFVVAYFRLLKPKGISGWNMADILAPSIALGLCLGRIGCLLNGCCYGHVACADCPAITFPMPAEPRKALTRQGLQTAAGFLVDPALKVTAVEPGSAAADAGLKPGDIIEAVNGKAVPVYTAFDEILTESWPRGENEMRLTVTRNGERQTLTFAPRSIGLHPTQLYETISAGLLVFLLLAYFPLRKRYGEVIALLMFGYAIHRFLNEQIRNDTGSVAFGLTQAQIVSIVLLAGAVFVFWWVRRQPAQPAIAGGPAPEAEPESEAPAETALQD